MLVYISGCCRIAYFLQNVLWCLVSQLFFKNLINNIIYAVGKKEKKKKILRTRTCCQLSLSFIWNSVYLIPQTVSSSVYLNSMHNGSTVTASIY